MFWRRQRKSYDLMKVEELLSLGDSNYISTVEHFVTGMEPATRAHVAVAYQNLLPMISAAYTVNRDRGIPFTIETFIPELSRAADSGDAIVQRRFSWFTFAALIARLEKMARSNNEVDVIGAAVWVKIASDYPLLRVLLPNNIVWSAREKEWFELPAVDSDLTELAVNYHIPLRFAKQVAVEEFAKTMGIFYYPSASRIGFVP